ncbi:MAG: hypothetical protein ACNI3A_18015 [Desulfovibrio sp.]
MFRAITIIVAKKTEATIWLRRFRPPATVKRTRSVLILRPNT